MNNKEIWILFTKSKPLEGCTIDIDGCEFYFAEVFVPSDGIANGEDTIDKIVSRAREALLNSRLALSDISKCIRYQAEEWSEDTAVNKTIHAGAQNALASLGIEFGGFRSEDIEEDYRYSHTVYEIDSE